MEVFTMRFIDMHLHTTASDGSCSPSEVCQLAIDSNLAAIAITDHDTVDGVSEAIAYADKWNSTLPMSKAMLPAQFFLTAEISISMSFRA